MLFFRIAFIIAIAGSLNAGKPGRETWSAGKHGGTHAIILRREYEVKVMENTNQSKSLEAIEESITIVKTFINVAATTTAAAVGVIAPVAGALVSLIPIIMDLLTPKSTVSNNDIVANEIAHIRATIETIKTETKQLQNDMVNIQQKTSILHGMYRDIDKWVNYLAEPNCAFRSKPLIAIDPLAAIAPLITIFDTFKHISEPETAYGENITTKFRQVLNQYKSLAVKNRLQRVEFGYMKTAFTSFSTDDYYTFPELIDDLANERDIRLPEGDWPYIHLKWNCRIFDDRGYYIKDDFQQGRSFCVQQQTSDHEIFKLYLALLDCKVNKVFDKITKMTDIPRVKGKHDTAPNYFGFYKNRLGVTC